MGIDRAKFIPSSSHAVDESIVRLNKRMEEAQNAKDTTLIIQSLFDLTQLYMTELGYTKAYESIWKALKLAQESSDSIHMARIYQNLSELYAIYGKAESSSDYIHRAIQINKKFIARDSVNATALTENYFKATVNFITVDKFDLAGAYSDSCLHQANLLRQDTLHKCYIFTAKAYLAIQLGELVLAENYLNQSLKVFESIPVDYPNYAIHKSYLVFVYAYLGDLYFQMGRYPESKAYYLQCLDTMKYLNSHLGLRPYVLYNLARTYNSNLEFEKAYNAMRLSKHMYDSVYGIKSEQNIQLLEVRNNLQAEINKKNKELYQKALVLSQKEHSLFRIKLVLAAIVFIILILIVYARNKIHRDKFQLEKEIRDREIYLKEKAAEELLEVKNKELTTYTLQFIEKEKTIAELNELLKNQMGGLEHKKQLTSVNSGSNLWEEFNHRFNSVNTGFYERLHSQFPQLSSTELKHCALIKLNFSGKEMAHLLGISTSSVHISRHRLRKKMGLDRETSLSSFISKL